MSESLLIEKLPARERLHELLDYDPLTGAFHWKPRGHGKFDKPFAGKPAFTSDWHGYRCGALLGKNGVLAHRVAFKYVHGWEPPEIDHINGDRSDNRAANLRGVTAAENRKNACRPRTNTSGIVGVSFRADKGRWRAFITVNYRRLDLGYFDTKDGAIEARRAAERLHGFHENHGRAA